MSALGADDGRMEHTDDVTDVDGSRPDAWGYLVDVRERGLDRTVADYR